jgi:hypothetical protein
MSVKRASKSINKVEDLRANAEELGSHDFEANEPTKIFISVDRFVQKIEGQSILLIVDKIGRCGCFQNFIMRYVSYILWGTFDFT